MSFFEWMEYDNDDQERAYWRPREKFGMTRKTIRSEITELKRWLTAHSYLPSSLISANEDLWLDNYLLLNKYDLEKTKSNLDTYFKIRTVLPEAFESRHPLAEDIEKSFRSTCVALIPKLTEAGHMICLYHHFSTSPMDFEAVPLGKRFIAMIDVQLQCTRINRTGTVVVCDLINFRFGHLTRYKPIRLVRAFFNLVWKAYPERIAQIHIINAPIGFQPALMFFKPFLKEKLRNRIMIHSNLEDLYKYVPRSHLPSDYGGVCATMQELNDMWQDILIQQFDWLETCGKKHKIADTKWPEKSGDEYTIPADSTTYNYLSTFG